jgi:hypothetical protein
VNEHLRAYNTRAGAGAKVGGGEAGPYNKRAVAAAERAGAVVSHDDRLPQTGEGVEGERLSPLPNTPADFPAPSYPSRNFGARSPHEDLLRPPTEHRAPESRLPERVSGRDVFDEIVARRTSTNIGRPRDGREGAPEESERL